MTDKEKILAEIERLRNELNFEPFTDEVLGKRNVLDKISKFINSLPEEPVIPTIDKDVSRMADEFAEREYETDGYERQWLSKGYYHGFMDSSKIKTEEPVSEDLEDAAIKYADENTEDPTEMDEYDSEYFDWHDYCERVYKAGAQWQKESIWHKESDHPNNRHPYPVLNPDGEMAFAYYDQLSGWQFDRDFKHSVNMMWLDIEKILPKKN